MLPTVIPYLIMDRARGLRELPILFVRAPGGAGWHVLTDNYCVNPSCECTEVVIQADEVTGEIPTRAPRSDEEAEAMLRGFVRRVGEGTSFVWDYAAGTLLYLDEDDEPQSDTPPEAQPIREAIARALAGEAGPSFRERNQLAKEWGKEHYWTVLHWEDVDEDETVAWEYAFPHEPPYEVERNGVRYVLRDLYCVQPDCDCELVDLVLETAPAGGRRGKSIASITVSTRHGHVGVASVLDGKAFLAKRLLEDLLRTHPEARTVFPARIERMHEIADYRQALIDSLDTFDDDLEADDDDDAWDEDSEVDESEDDEALPDELPGGESELRRLALLGDPAEADAARILEDLERAPRVRPPEADGMDGAAGDDDEVALPEGLPGPAAGSARGSMPGRKSGSAPGPKVGRNDPCPCGSGKKFKKCCGR